MSSAEGFEDNDPLADNRVYVQLANAATEVLDKGTRIISASSCTSLTHGTVRYDATIMGCRKYSDADTAYLTVSSAGDTVARFQFFPTKGVAVVETLPDPKSAMTIIGELPHGFCFGAQDLLAGLIQPEHEYPTPPDELESDWRLGVLGAMVANTALTQTSMRIIRNDAYRGVVATGAILQISYYQFKHMTPRDSWKSDPRKHPDPIVTARLRVNCQNPSGHTESINIEDPYGAAPLASSYEGGFDKVSGNEQCFPSLPAIVATELTEYLANSVPLHML